MQTCIYCGNNPVPHLTHKFYESLDIIMGPMRRTITQSWFGNFTDHISTWVAMGLLKLLQLFGCIKINRDINQVPFERAKVLWQEALDRSIEMEEIKPFGRSIDLYRARLPSPAAQANGGQAKINGKPIYFMNLPRKEKTSTSNLAWIDDKFLLKMSLLEHHFPVAPGGSCTTSAQALAAFRALDKPVIVKPRAGSRGRHTTTLVYTEEDLKKAFRVAKKLCYWIIVEEHLFGDVQRATIIGGKLIGMLGGSPPRVTGNGIHTIDELIAIKDSARPDKVKETKVNRYFMQRNNLDMDTILPLGQTVDLSEKIGVNYGGTSYDATRETHPEIKQMLEEAAKVLDISILGFDYIIPDITKSYKEQKSGIIECNGAPFIQLHYDPLYGESINAAKYVWDLVT